MANLLDQAGGTLMNVVTLANLRRVWLPPNPTPRLQAALHCTARRSTPQPHSTLSPLLASSPVRCGDGEFAPPANASHRPNRRRDWPPPARIPLRRLTCPDPLRAGRCMLQPHNHRLRLRLACDDYSGREQIERRHGLGWSSLFAAAAPAQDGRLRFARSASRRDTKTADETADGPLGSGSVISMAALSPPHLTHRCHCFTPAKSPPRPASASGQTRDGNSCPWPGSHWRRSAQRPVRLPLPPVRHQATGEKDKRNTCRKRARGRRGGLGGSDGTGGKMQVDPTASSCLGSPRVASQAPARWHCIAHPIATGSDGFCHGLSPARETARLESGPEEPPSSPPTSSPPHPTPAPTPTPSPPPTWSPWAPSPSAPVDNAASGTWALALAHALRLR